MVKKFAPENVYNFEQVPRKYQKKVAGMLTEAYNALGRNIVDSKFKSSNFNTFKVDHYGDDHFAIIAEDASLDGAMKRETVCKVDSKINKIEYVDDDHEPLELKEENQKLMHELSEWIKTEAEKKPAPAKKPKGKKGKTDDD